MQHQHRHAGCGSQTTRQQQVVPATHSRLTCRPLAKLPAYSATAGGVSQPTLRPVQRRSGRALSRASQQLQGASSLGIFPAPTAARVSAQPVSTPGTAASTAAASQFRATGSARMATAAVPPTALQYSADTAADEWSRRPVPVVARLLEISAAFGSWWVKSKLHNDPQKAAADMRKVLVDLGPAFVKIGQALSSRPDVLPPEYTTELEVLQDRIPPFSNDEALQVIEEDLGMPWTQVFSSLSSCPVAAASLGQVYRGRLFSNGAEVAVKVQRPGVVEAIGRDTYILRNLADIARKQAKLNTDLPALVDEWASSLFKELDYTREAANAIRFAELFSFMPEVMVPKMYTEWTTSRVLVMEWVEGERLRSASSQAPAAAAAVTASAGSGSIGAQVAMRQQLIQQQRSSPEQVAEDLRLVEIGVRCSLEQMLEEGFYHADPHPGNLLKTQDGRLAYIDFGMMGSIEPGVRQALIRATLHLVNREYELLADDFVALGLLPRGSDMDAVIPALTGVFQTALAGGVSNLSFGTLSTDLGRTMYKYSFRLPPYYTLLVRSLSVLEGIALASDPNYKVLGAAYPWVSRRLLLTTNSPELTATLDNLLYDSSGRFNFDRLESLLEQAAKARVQANAAARSPAAAAGGAGSHGTSSNMVVSSYGRSSSSAAAAQQGRQQDQGLLASVAAAVGGALAGPEGSELLLSSLQLLSGSNGSSGGGWQQQVSGRGSAAAAAGGPLALVLSPEGRHIRGILEDELAKGLDAAWRLNLDRTLDVASERLEGALSFAARTPLGSTLVPQWLQDQVRQSHNSSSSSSNGDGSRYVISSGSEGVPVTVASSSSSGDLDGRPDLIESLLNLPRLAGEDDRVQVDGLRRLAVQLAAFSGPAGTTPATSSSSRAVGGVAGVKQRQQVQGQQQEANAASLQQVRQAALVLRWFTSEVQLLSPDAQREALAIPMRILSKLGSRVAARAVRAVLTPSRTSGSGMRPNAAAVGGFSRSGPAAAPAGSLTSSSSSTNVAAGAVAGQAVAASAGASGALSTSSSSSNGVVMAPVGPAVQGAGRAAAVEQQPTNGKVLTVSSRSSNGSSNSSMGSNGSTDVYSNGSSSSDGATGGSNSSSVGQAEVGYNGVVAGGNGARGAGSPLQSDGKGGLKGGRMLLLKDPSVVDAGV